MSGSAEYPTLTGETAAALVEFFEGCELARRENTYVRPGIRVCNRAMLRDSAITLALIATWVAVFVLDQFTLSQGLMAHIALVALRRYAQAIFVSELLAIWRAREALGTSPLWEAMLEARPSLAEVERGMDLDYEAAKAWRWWKFGRSAVVPLQKRGSRE